MNAKNLAKLATHLEKLPLDYSHFDMNDFQSEDGSVDIRFSIPKAEVSCGTSACAVGHGPWAGIRVSKYDVDWEHYSDRVFGVSIFDDGAGDFMFAAEWARPDPTHRGAAARIRYVLDGGRDFDSRDPATYAKYLVA